MRNFIFLFKQRVVAMAALIFVLSAMSFAQNPPRSPSDIVREFYKTMHDRKFREAFALSIYKPAIEGLTPQEFEDLRPDFERMAAAIPEKVDLTGEQISGDAATVFVKVTEGAEGAEPQPLSLIKVNGSWIVGDRESEAIVKQAGKDFFFKARIDTHHSEVQSMFQKIVLAQLVYNKQHGQFANLAELIEANLIPKDLEGTESTGYSFHVVRTADGKTWYATAEPAQYGRTGKLSFFLDASGVRSGDNGGKPLVVK